MARIGGRSTLLAVPVGILCAAVVAGLLWLAVPAIPFGVQWIGDTLRGPTSAPAAQATHGPGPAAAPSVEACRGIYTDALWQELSQRAGGDPKQDAAAPETSASSLVAALAPTVRETCTWKGAQLGGIVTTVSDVPASSTGVARAAFESQGFSCSGYGDGIRCLRTTGDVTEDQAIRGGVWLATTFTSWQPQQYTERIAPQLWPR
ncbi:hypothetical protein ABCS02_10930 [Microbacterium sp. X-17]|uniref:hypothetical protein n=1 Tax=Microbacterium sp. X-17 TaxID=3144404 RepID=UPI0031F56F18